jgi:hypothetical protein
MPKRLLGKSIPGAIRGVPGGQPVDKSSTILLFIPAGSDTKANAMDDQRPGIINELRFLKRRTA